MGRPVEGNVWFNGRCWEARIPLPKPFGWTKRDAPIKRLYFEELTIDDEKNRAFAKAAAIEVIASGIVTNGTGKTVGEYAKGWLAAREEKISSIRDQRAHIRDYIEPIIGLVPIADVNRSHIEEFVASLDKKVSAHQISPKTAKNIWGTCTKMFDDAANAKQHTGLRCLGSNPTDGVRGPDDDEDDKLLQFLYPSEFKKFVESEKVSIPWRRNVAIAVYLCLRDGEQRALRWVNVDLEHGVVTVAQTYNRRLKVVKDGTKASAGRVVNIPNALLPMLRAMREESEGKGLVCKLPSERDMARGLRCWLGHAGVDREALYTTTTASKQLRWHDLRATGLTWHAVDGKPATEIRDIAGHAQTAMTDRYMRAANMLRGGRFGEVFSALPKSLNGSWSSVQGSVQDTEKEDLTTENHCGADGTRRGPQTREITGKSEDRGPRPSTHRGPTTDSPSASLEAAIAHASKAGQWDVVRMLAKQLEGAS